MSEPGPQPGLDGWPPDGVDVAMNNVVSQTLPSPLPQPLMAPTHPISTSIPPPGLPPGGSLGPEALGFVAHKLFLPNMATDPVSPPSQPLMAPTHPLSTSIPPPGLSPGGSLGSAALGFVTPKFFSPQAAPAPAGSVTPPYQPLLASTHPISTSFPPPGLPPGGSLGLGALGFVAPSFSASQVACAPEGCAKPSSPLALAYPACPPPGATAEDLMAYESALFKCHQPAIVCQTCPLRPRLGSNGGAGNRVQKGRTGVASPRRLQLRCPTCKASKQFHLLLAEQGKVGERTLTELQAAFASWSRKKVSASTNPTATHTGCVGAPSDPKQRQLSFAAVAKQPRKRQRQRNADSDSEPEAGILGTPQTDAVASDEVVLQQPRPAIMASQMEGVMQVASQAPQEFSFEVPPSLVAARPSDAPDTGPNASSAPSFQHGVVTRDAEIGLNASEEVRAQVATTLIPTVSESPPSVGSPVGLAPLSQPSPVGRSAKETELMLISQQLRGLRAGKEKAVRPPHNLQPQTGNPGIHQGRAAAQPSNPARVVNTGSPWHAADSQVVESLKAENAALREELHEALHKVNALEDRMDRMLALMEARWAMETHLENSAPTHPQVREADQRGIRPPTAHADARAAKAKSASQQRAGSGPGGRVVPGFDRIDTPQAQPAVEVVENAIPPPVVQGSPVKSDWQTVHTRGPKPLGSRPTPEQLKKRQLQVDKIAEQALSDRVTPAEFRMVYVELKDPRGLLRSTGRVRELAITQLLRAIGIAHLVSGASLVPGGVLQLVCRLGAALSVEEAICEARLKLRTDINPFARIPHSRLSPEVEMEKLAKRLAFLCLKSQARNFHEAVLKGATPEQRAKVLAAYRLLTKRAKAQLGHADHWYMASAGHQTPLAGSSIPDLPAVAGESGGDGDAEMSGDLHH
jgi:hypothetical protein